jgi:hypothetical protein
LAGVTLAMRMAVTILPAGAAGLLVDLVVLALVDLLAAGLVSDFFDTAMAIYLTWNFRVW